MHGISKTGRPYPKGMRYEPPEPELCEFLANCFPKLKDSERKERMDLAKRLIELYSGPKRREFSQSKITATFSWMYQAGIIDYERVWHRLGGWRHILWRCAEKEKIEDLLARRPVFLDGEELNPSACASKADVAAADEVSDPVKKKKKCCDRPRIVRKKKSGRRLCKNCGKELKSRAKNEQ